MAAATLSDVRRGVKGRLKTFQCKYVHLNSSDWDIVTGLNNVQSFRVQNLTQPDVAMSSADFTTTAGTITIGQTAITHTSSVLVYAEGW